MGEPEGYSRKELIHRIGTFFLLLAAGFIVLFILSDSAGELSLSYFCWGMILIIIGFAFRSQFKKSRPVSGRFSGIKKFLKGKKDD